MKKNHFLIGFILLLIIFSLLYSFVFGNHNSYNLSDNFISSSIPQVEWKAQSCQNKLSLLERLIMLNFSPQITEAVKNFYHELRGSDLNYITDVRAVGPYEYEMKIQISTFVGAHNPPYGLDVVTLRFKNLRDGEVVNYEHKEDY